MSSSVTKLKSLPIKFFSKSFKWVKVSLEYILLFSKSAGSSKSVKTLFPIRILKRLIHPRAPLTKLRLYLLASAPVNLRLICESPVNIPILGTLNVTLDNWAEAVSVGVLIVFISPACSPALLVESKPNLKYWSISVVLILLYNTWIFFF